MRKLWQKIRQRLCSHPTLAYGVGNKEDGTGIAVIWCSKCRGEWKVNVLDTSKDEISKWMGQENVMDGLAGVLSKSLEDYNAQQKGNSDVSVKP